MNDLITIRRALLSVSDKKYLLDLAQCLATYKVELIASGGTATTLKQAGYAVTSVEELSGKGEAFQGRMKTLSFEISSALLYKRDDPQDVKQAEVLKIRPIDLVVVNLYPFHQTVERNADLKEVIENIDIGGPTLLRAGSKNYNHVSVLSRPEQYQEFIHQMKEHKGATSLHQRKKWSTEAFTLTAFYDLEVAQYMTSMSEDVLRYGENPHQKAVVLKTPFSSGLVHMTPIQGKEMSYNNYLDADFALQTLKDIHLWNQTKKHNLHSAVVVKHNTPCGIASHQNTLTALEHAWEGDKKSSFGGVIALSFPVTSQVASFFEDKFVEVLMAPSFDTDAIKMMKKNCRLIKVSLDMVSGKNVRSVEGGLLVQDKDQFKSIELKSVTNTPIPPNMTAVAEFSFLCVKNLKSNAIALAKRIDTDDSFELLTMGSGQTNRIDCIEKLIRSRLDDKKITKLDQVVLASDAFFPFADSVQAAAALGVGFIVQPGGSIKDNEVIAEANQKKIAMAFTGKRHFLH